MSADYQLVHLRNGAKTIRYIDVGETLHPVAGPAAEAEALYVNQLRLRERFAACRGEFVIWDVGLGAAANALMALRALAPLGGTVRMVSFDTTLEALRFAVGHSEALGYIGELRGAVERVVTGERELSFRTGATEVQWRIEIGDFPTRIAAEADGNSSKNAGSTLPLPAPHAVLFDAFPPASNPEMWTLSMFSDLFARLNPARPCSLATYSRTTFARVSLLLAGFYAGIGDPVDGKEETTVAANDLSLVARPLDKRWLDKVRRSHSAEPLLDPVYRQAPLAGERLAALEAHPQFR